MSSTHLDEARDCSVAFAIRHSEKARLRALAAEADITLSAYLHRLLTRELKYESDEGKDGA